MRRVTMWLLLSVVSICGVPAIALAHATFSDPAPIEPSRAALSSGTASRLILGDAIDARVLLAVGLAIAGILATRRRRCRALRIVALALLLAWGGFETSVHSVHHLANPEAAERCLVASSGVHTHAVESDAPPSPHVSARVLGTVLAVPPPLGGAVVIAPGSVRAPPA